MTYSAGNKVTVIAGARLRRVSQDNKSLLDQKMYEGALVERDSPAKIVHVITPKDRDKTPQAAYVIDLTYEGKQLYGWIYESECAGPQTW